MDSDVGSHCVDRLIENIEGACHRRWRGEGKGRCGKRNQVPTACGPCRRAHYACTSPRPCDRCVRLNEVCIDPPKKSHKRYKEDQQPYEPLVSPIALPVPPLVLPLPPFAVLSPQRSASPLEYLPSPVDPLIPSDLDSSEEIPIPLVFPAPDIPFPEDGSTIICAPASTIIHAKETQEEAQPPITHKAPPLTSEIIPFKHNHSAREFTISKEAYDNTFVNLLRDDTRYHKSKYNSMPFNKDVNLEKLVHHLLKSHKKLELAVQDLTQEGCKAIWRLPDFRLIECNQSFLNLFGWKTVPQVFFLNNLLKVEIQEMFKHCAVLREFLDNPYGVTTRNITKKFRRCGTEEMFKCAVILTLDLKKNVFVTVLREL